MAAQIHGTLPRGGLADFIDDFCCCHGAEPQFATPGVYQGYIGVSLDIENYCTLRLFFDLSTLAGLSRRNLPEASIRLLFHI